MPDTITLRFRDYEHDTIVEHRKLISEYGYVYWGWWKKKDEPDRLTCLSDLDSRTHGRITIGLFDRSTGQFFMAKTDSIHVRNGEHFQSPDPDKTPSYYRHETLPCWFKFTEIETISKKKFKEMFDVIPAGEHTLFPVWKSDDQDSKSMLVSNRGQRTEEIPLPGNSIVHISDLHFGADFGDYYASRPGSTDLITLLLSDIKKLDLKVGLLVVSGDLTTRADSNVLFDTSLPFLQKLTGALGLKETNVVIVPGNHDIPLSRHNPINYDHETTFKRFLKDFYGKDLELMGLDKYILPSGQNIDLLRINSVRLRSPAEKNYGYVEWGLYDSFLQNLGKRKPRDLRIAVMHHHLLQAPTEEVFNSDYPDAGVSVTLDAGTVLNGLQKHDFRLVLHGHQHTAAITRVSRGRTADSGVELVGIDEPVYVSAAGSLSTSRTSPSMPFNSYSTLTIEQEKLNLRVRRFTPALEPADHFTSCLDY